MDQMQVPCLPKKKWDLRERQRSNDSLVLVVVLVLESVRDGFAECGEGQRADTPALRSQGIEDEDDDEYEDETLMSVSLLLGSGVFRILFLFTCYLLWLFGAA
jgi:hypothetical protein